MSEPIFNLVFYATWYLLYMGILRVLRNENILGLFRDASWIWNAECKVVCVSLYEVTYLDTAFFIGCLFPLKKSIQDINSPTYLLHSLLHSLFLLITNLFLTELVLVLVLCCGEVMGSLVADLLLLFLLDCIISPPNDWLSPVHRMTYRPSFSMTFSMCFPWWAVPAEWISPSLEYFILHISMFEYNFHLTRTF